MSFPLAGLFIILAIEYLGIAYHYIPVLKSLPVSLGLAAVLFLYVVLKQGATGLFRFAQTKMLVIFMLLTTAALAYGLIRSYAITPLKQQVGYFLLTVIGYFAFRKPNALRYYAIVMVLLHVLLVVVNAEQLQQAERVGSFKAGYFMGDGNDFAWALNVMLPFALFLALEGKGLLERLLGAAGVAALAFGIVGTQSRGATLALAAGAIYFLAMISRRKIFTLVLLTVVVVGGLAFAPSDYLSRMETISSYEEDTSAMGRLRAWGHAIEMAIDHPLAGVGAGSFNSAYGRYYRGEGDPQHWISTHSIYFKVLGEYGFAGLYVFLLVLWYNFRDNVRSAQWLRRHPPPEGISPQLPLYMNMAWVAFAVAGTFLSGVNYPHLFMLMGATLALRKTIMDADQSGREPAPETESLAALEGEGKAS